MGRAVLVAVVQCFPSFLVVGRKRKDGSFLASHRQSKVFLNYKISSTTQYLDCCGRLVDEHVAKALPLHVIAVELFDSYRRQSGSNAFSFRIIFDFFVSPLFGHCRQDETLIFGWNSHSQSNTESIY